MSRVARYHFEKFSIFDIKEYLKQKGYYTEVKQYEDLRDKLYILDSDVNIDIPFKVSSDMTLADIHFEDYPRTDNYEKSKKLYAELKRKFAVKKGEFPQVIKDKDRMNIKDFS